MPEILVQKDASSRGATASSELLARHAARLFLAGGAVLLAGVLIDLFALWVLQRQDTIQWEFVALGSTTNSYTLMVVGAALLYGALAVTKNESVTAWRLVGGLVLLMGLFGLVIGFLIGTNYLAVRREAGITPEVSSVFKGLVVKAGGVSLLFGLAMTAAGALGLRMPRRK